MERTTLRCGLEVSRLGLGLSRLHYVSESAGIALIGAARDLGITHFDTARLYGDGWSERVLGRALKDGRRKVTITTKFGLAANPLFEALGSRAYLGRGLRSVLRRAGLITAPRSSFGVEQLDRSLRRSLQALQTDYVDMLLLHEADAEALATAGDALFERLLSLRRSGAIRAIGITATGLEADAVLTRWGAAIDVVQAPVDSLPSVQPADIIYGALSAGQQHYGSRALRPELVQARLSLALSTNQQSCILVGTSRREHLRSLAAGALKSGIDE